MTDFLHDARKFLTDAFIYPCGSRVTCDPPPIDTDWDFLVLIPEGERRTMQLLTDLEGCGYECETTDKHYQDDMREKFLSFRRDEINLIVTSSKSFVEKHLLATAVCKALNLMVKKDRVALFKAILYGEAPKGSQVALL